MLKKQNLKKIIAINLVFALFSNCVFAHLQEATIWNVRRRNLPQSLSLPRTFERTVPRSKQQWNKLGVVSQELKPRVKTDRTVYLIQDVHSDTTAQKNIGKIIQYLHSEAPLDLVALEGAVGDINLKPFLTFPTLSAVQLSAEDQLHRHRLSGPIYSLLSMGKNTISVFGLETKSLLEENKQAYRDSYSTMDQHRSDLEIEYQEIEAQKNEIYSSRFLNFDKDLQRFRNNTMPMADYLRVLVSHSGPVPFEVTQFLRAVGLEKAINFQKLAIEKKEIERLAKTEPWVFQNNKWKSKFVEAKTYLAYEDIASKINTNDLLVELQALEEQALHSFKMSELEMRLLARSERNYLEKKLVSFSLTPYEWDKYKAMHSKELVGQNTFERFYECAEDRNNVMAQALLRKMELLSACRVVMVAGGFHSQSVANTLLRFGYQVVVVRPNLDVDKLNSKPDYLRAFLNKKTPLEKLFSGEKLFLADSPLRPGELALDISARAHRLGGIQFPAAVRHFSHSIIMPTVVSLKETSHALLVDLLFRSEEVTMTFVFDEEGNIRDREIMASYGFWGLVALGASHFSQAVLRSDFLILYLMGGVILAWLILFPNNRVRHNRFAFLTEGFQMGDVFSPLIFSTFTGSSHAKPGVETEMTNMPIPASFQEEFGARAEDLWSHFLKKNTPWGHLLENEKPVVAWAVKQLYAEAQLQYPKLKRIEDLTQKQFQKIRIPSFGKTIQKVYLLWGEKINGTELKPLGIVPSLLSELGLIEKPLAWEGLDTIEKLIQFTSGKRSQIVWDRVPKILIRHLVEDLACGKYKISLLQFQQLSAEERSRMVLSLDLYDLKNRKLVGPIYKKPLSALYRDVSIKRPNFRTFKNPRWIILEEAGYIDKDVPALNQLKTLQDLHSLFVSRAIHTIIPWKRISARSPEIPKLIVKALYVSKTNTVNSFEQLNELMDSVPLDELVSLVAGDYKRIQIPLFSSLAPTLLSSFYEYHHRGVLNEEDQIVLPLEILRRSGLFPNLPKASEIGSLKSFIAYRMLLPKINNNISWGGSLARPVIRRVVFYEALNKEGNKKMTNLPLNADWMIFGSLPLLKKIKSLKPFLKRFGFDLASLPLNSKNMKIIMARMGFVTTRTKFLERVESVDKGLRLLNAQPDQFLWFKSLPMFHEILKGNVNDPSLVKVDEGIEVLERSMMELQRNRQWLKDGEFKTLKDALLSYWALFDTAYMNPTMYLQVQKSRPVDDAYPFLEYLYALHENAQSENQINVFRTLPSFSDTSGALDYLNSHNTAISRFPLSVGGAASIPIFERIFVSLFKSFGNEKSLRRFYRKAVAWLAEAPFAPGMGGYFIGIIIESAFSYSPMRSWIIGNALASVFFIVVHKLNSRGPPSDRVYFLAVVGFFLSFVFTPNPTGSDHLVLSTAAVSFLHLILNNVHYSSFSKLDTKPWLRNMFPLLRLFFLIGVVFPLLESTALKVGHMLASSIVPSYLNTHDLFVFMAALVASVIHVKTGVLIGKETTRRPVTAPQFLWMIVRWLVYSSLLVFGDNHSPGLGLLYAVAAHAGWNAYAFFNGKQLDTAGLKLVYWAVPETIRDERERVAWRQEYIRQVIGALTNGNLTLLSEVVDNIAAPQSAETMIEFYRWTEPLDLESLGFTPEVIAHQLSRYVFIDLLLGLPLLKKLIQVYRENGLSISEQEVEEAFRDERKFRDLCVYLNPYFHRSQKMRRWPITFGEDHSWAYYVLKTIKPGILDRYDQLPLLINVDPHNDLLRSSMKIGIVTDSTWASYALKDELVSGYVVVSKSDDGSLFIKFYDNRFPEGVPLSPKYLVALMRRGPYVLTVDADQFSLRRDQHGNSEERHAKPSDLLKQFDFIREIVVDSGQLPIRFIGAISRDYLHEKADETWVDAFKKCFRIFSFDLEGMPKEEIRAFGPLGEASGLGWFARVMAEHHRGQESWDSIDGIYSSINPMNLEEFGLTTERLIAGHLTTFVNLEKLIGISFLKAVARNMGLIDNQVVPYLNGGKKFSNLIRYIHPYRLRAEKEKNKKVTDADFHEWTYFKLRQWKLDGNQPPLLINFDPHHDMQSAAEGDDGEKLLFGAASWVTFAMKEGLVSGYITVFLDPNRNWKIIEYQNSIAGAITMLSMRDLLTKIKSTPYYLTNDGDGLSLGPLSEVESLAYWNKFSIASKLKWGSFSDFFAELQLGQHVRPEDFNLYLGPLFKALNENGGPPVGMDAIASEEYLNEQANPAWVAAWKAYVHKAGNDYFGFDETPSDVSILFQWIYSLPTVVQPLFITVLVPLAETCLLLLVKNGIGSDLNFIVVGALLGFGFHLHQISSKVQANAYLTRWFFYSALMVVGGWHVPFAGVLLGFFPHFVRNSVGYFNNNPIDAPINRGTNVPDGSFGLSELNGAFFPINDSPPKHPNFPSQVGLERLKFQMRERRLLGRSA